MADICKDLTKFQAGVDKTFATTLEDEVDKQVDSVVSMAVTEVQNGAAALGDRWKLADHLREFAFAFPMENEINDATSQLSTCAQANKQSALVHMLMQRCEWVIASGPGSVGDAIPGIRGLCEAAET